MDIQKDKKTKENIKGKRKRGLIVPLFLAYQNKYLQFNLYPKLYRQVAESKENIGCKCATLGGLLFNLAFYVYKAYIFSVPRCSNGLNSSLKESDFDQSILETNVPNERIAFLGFT
ncbi:hypothetical protein [Anaerotignum faecicola]|jgi:hypothetical protein